MAAHLIKRFFTTLFARDLNEEERTWLFAHLNVGERDLWERFERADRRHSYQVAKRAEKFFGDDATPVVIAAAALHDIGKIEVKAGVFLRVLATLASTTGSEAQVYSWSQEPGWLGRAGRYLRSHELAEEHLVAAGSDPLVVAWAREHELAPSRWTIPREVGAILKRADDI